jgi:hypothetical protein
MLIQGKSLLELTGLHRRKVLRALVWWRRKNGVPVGDTARWAVAVVDVAAAIFGRRLSVPKATNTATVINVDIGGNEVLDRLVAKAVAEMADGIYQPVPSKVLGSLVGLTSDEKRSVADILGLNRISIQAIDHDADRKKRRRELALQQRTKAAAQIGRVYTPRALSKSALAKAAGVDRSTLYRRAQKANATVSCPLPVGPSLPAVSVPNDATVSCPLPRETQQFRDPSLYLGNSHGSVAPIAQRRTAK